MDVRATGPLALSRFPSSLNSVLCVVWVVFSLWHSSVANTALKRDGYVSAFPLQAITKFYRTAD